jgi:hypothetical protein
MSIRVSLAPRIVPVENRPAEPVALPLLDSRGAQVILGTGIASDALAAPIAPSPHSLFGPRGACLCGPDGPLVISDTGHHRLLIWNTLPESDDAAADLVIGQPDFVSEGRNAHGPIGAATLNVPTGVAFGDGVLAVADAWNHRVLLWHGMPRHSNQPADVVLGQEDFAAGLANRGKDAPTAATLNWCYGVTIADGRLYVADTGNRRVLVWDRVPTTSGAPADRVLGQQDFVTRDEGSGGDARLGMRWPHAVTVADGRCLVADAGTSRVMVWRAAPRTNGVPCDFVLGQSGFGAGEHNGGYYLPTAAVLNMPYGIAHHAGRIVVADTANSRLLGFTNFAMGVAAESLAGQVSFDAKGDNRWQAAERDSLCWPYAVMACDDLFVIADTGNNRVLLWKAA